MIKRFLCVILALIVCILSVISMTSCGSLPNIDLVKDRFIYLIEESKEINAIFFGVGLPVHNREGSLSNRQGIYYNDTLPSYNTVTKNSPYPTVDKIKEKAENVFSKEYLELIYEGAFDGIVSTGGTYLRFYELEGDLYQSIGATDFGLSERIYDYSTMEIVKPSNNEYINVIIQTYTLSDKKTKEVSLSFVFERGDWYLDCPTY